MDKLIELISLCKCAVSLDINDHRSFYETIEQAVAEIDDKDITSEMRQRIIENDNLVRLQAYVNTPVSFILIYHYDVNAAIEEAIRIIRE